MKSYFEITNNRKKYVCEKPSMCPMCNSKISPLEMYSFLNGETGYITRSFECPACGKGFITHLKAREERVLYGGEYYYQTSFIGAYPNHPVTRNFDDSILKVSPSFCDIYNQALAAEAYGLNEISGIAYRKSLEFLIKDYCIYKRPDATEEIKKEPLSQVITNYVEGERIKTNAKASTWLGNDETHYTKKYEDKDINDLKKFIEATLAYINYEVISDEAEEFINSNQS